MGILREVMTICFLVRKDLGADLVCLPEKKRDFRAGKINGYGGKQEKEESIEECAKREVQEESGVTVRALEKYAEVIYHNTDIIFECHVFIIRDWEGEPVETGEMSPQWYFINRIPFYRMGQADELWIPQVLRGERLKANFYYDKGFKDKDTKLIDWEIEPVKSF